MARLKLKASNSNATMRNVGRLVYQIALAELDPALVKPAAKSKAKAAKKGKSKALAATKEDTIAGLKQELEGLFDLPEGKPPVYVVDKADKVHIVIPYLGTAEKSTIRILAKGQADFADEALGFVVIFGCGL